MAVGILMATAAMLMMVMSGLTMITVGCRKELRTVTGLLMAGLVSTDFLLGAALMLTVVTTITVVPTATTPAHAHLHPMDENSSGNVSLSPASEAFQDERPEQASLSQLRMGVDNATWMPETSSSNHSSDQDGSTTDSWLTSDDQDGSTTDRWLTSDEQEGITTDSWLTSNQEGITTDSWLTSNQEGSTTDSWLTSVQSQTQGHWSTSSGNKIPSVEWKWVCNRLQPALMACPLLATLYISTLVACERYMFISWPFLHIRLFTKARLFISLACCWLLAVVMSITALSLDMLVLDSGTSNCELEVSRLFELYFTLPSFMLSLLCSGFMYASITRVALQHHAAVARLAPACAMEDPAELRWLGTKLRAGKMFGVVYGVLFACLVPSVVARLLSDQIPREIVRASFVVLLFNSVLNVPIYFIMSALFRRTVMRLMCRCCGCAPCKAAAPAVFVLSSAEIIARHVPRVQPPPEKVSQL